MKPLTTINDNFSTSPQISAKDLTDIKAGGFKSVICNRPDDEDGGAHPAHNLLESEAKELGLQFAYLPIVPGQINETHVEQFKTLISELPGPILGYCRLGIRSKTLYERAMMLDA
ncbi:beta-lactamase hydrolase domain-containing protein [Nitrosospira briensis]|uniref:beta-lactamase hydrolase domain-containing protein n=1 Tax=Nitrosospira briensis TaxID=35799 RepID=UPI0008EB6AE2|nr:sulfur transferase domain-containing protein [Nitrosospira briensis]SFO40958.1 sulfide:quinone oxidoreductase [Nitrosospira briensis]